MIDLLRRLFGPTELEQKVTEAEESLPAASRTYAEIRAELRQAYKRGEIDEVRRLTAEARRAAKSL